MWYKDSACDFGVQQIANACHWVTAERESSAADVQFGGPSCWTLHQEQHLNSVSDHRQAAAYCKQHVARQLRGFEHANQALA